MGSRKGEQRRGRSKREAAKGSEEGRSRRETARRPNNNRQTQQLISSQTKGLGRRQVGSRKGEQRRGRSKWEAAKGSEEGPKV